MAPFDTGPEGVSSGRFATLRLEEREGLRVLTLDRPPLNVLNIEMLEEIHDALTRVSADSGAAALLITGAGKAFCAGVDVADHTADRVERMIHTFHRALSDMASMDIPVVAAVNGAALGGGMEVTLACDVVLARAGAKLGQPEIRLGVLPPYAAATLPALVGRQNALDIVLSGRTILAEDAQRMGLVQHVFPKDDFADAAMAYAEDMASLSPPVLRLAKRALLRSVGADPDEALRAVERIYLEDLMRLDDAHEGLAAFMEKRPPAWKGA